MSDDHGNLRARVALIEGAGVDAPSLPAGLVDLWQRGLDCSVRRVFRRDVDSFGRWSSAPSF